MRIYIETYGCALNRADESIMKVVLTSRGHIMTGKIDEADAVIINTCTVRLDTEMRMLDRIRKLYEYTEKTGKKLIVAGCMAMAQPYQVRKIAPRTSLVSPQDASRIWRAVESSEPVVLLGGERDRKLVSVWIEKHIAYIPIQDGCLGNCSFCITKLARRRLVSYPMEYIIESIRKAVEMGAVEIELTGQDTASYGLDLYGRQMLPELLRRLSDVTGNYRVRIGMMNPDTLKPILDELIESMNNNPRVYRFLHIPVQSGSDKVLRIMRRRYSIEEYYEIIETLRRKIPDIAIATDIIVGHPGEEEEDFEATLKIIRELRFERVHFAEYTVRPNTYSASLPQVPTRVKKERLLRLLKLVEEVGLDVHRRYVGRKINVIITEYNKRWIGRTDNYIPVVIMDGDLFYGDRVEVCIEDATFYDLRGSICSPN